MGTEGSGVMGCTRCKRKLPEWYLVATFRDGSKEVFCGPRCADRELRPAAWEQRQR